MFDPSIGQWFQEDPIDFAGYDPNLRRYVRNSPSNAVDLPCLENLIITKGNKKGKTHELEFELKDATEQTLNNPEFKVGDTKIKVRAFKGGTNIIRNPRNPEGSPSSTSFAFVAMSDREEDIQWLQFSKRDYTLRAAMKPRAIYMSIKSAEGEVFIKKGEWRVDALSQKSAYVTSSGGDKTRAIVNGATFDKDYPFATAFADHPDLKRWDESLTEEFEAKTFLVVRGKIEYGISWKITASQDKKGWSPREAVITESGRDKVDLPPIETNSKGQWLWARGGGGAPFWIDNPLKK